jgi:hypothetical protein
MGPKDLSFALVAMRIVASSDNGLLKGVLGWGVGAEVLMLGSGEFGATDVAWSVGIAGRQPPH